MSRAKAAAGSSLTVFRELATRHGDWICHLFRDCPQLGSRSYETVTLTGTGDGFIPLCRQCRLISLQAALG